MTERKNNPRNNVKNVIIDQLKETVYGKDRNRVLLVIVTNNNSDTIDDCLEAALDLADGMCIFDTGSTDDTQDLVKEYLKDLKIPNKFVPLKKSEGVNNGYYKTVAYNQAVNFCKSKKWLLERTYCLFLDADEEIYYPENYNKEDLVCDCYGLSIKDNIKYGNLDATDLQVLEAAE